MRPFILALPSVLAVAAAIAAATPAAAVTLPAAPPAKLDRLPDDWLDSDLAEPLADQPRESAVLADSDAGRAPPPADCKPSGGTTGLILGAVAGGILGNVVDGGDHRTLGTLLGAGGGALLGREIEKKRDACK